LVRKPIDTIYRLDIDKVITLKCPRKQRQLREKQPRRVSFYLSEECLSMSLFKIRQIGILHQEQTKSIRKG
jgi:hypothetical protein